MQHVAQNIYTPSSVLCPIKYFSYTSLLESFIVSSIILLLGMIPGSMYPAIINSSIVITNARMLIIANTGDTFSYKLGTTNSKYGNPTPRNIAYVHMFTPQSMNGPPMKVPLQKNRFFPFQI
jgi:hypothetical protein